MKCQMATIHGTKVYMHQGENYKCFLSIYNRELKQLYTEKRETTFTLQSHYSSSHDVFDAA